MAYGLEWFPFYAHRFVTDTASWSAVEVGCYLRLLAHAWINRGIEKDPAALARVAGVTPREFAAIWRRRLAEKFTVRMAGGLVSNRKLESVRREQAEAYEKRASHGRAAAVARWGDRDASAMPEHSPSNANKNKDLDSSLTGRTTATSASGRARRSKKRDPEPGTAEFREAMVQAYVERIEGLPGPGDRTKMRILLDGGDLDALEAELEAIEGANVTRETSEAEA